MSLYTISHEIRKAAAEAPATFSPEWKEYLSGMSLYIDMHPLSDCTTKAMRRGWWDGLNAEAEADLDTRQGVTYPSNFDRR